MSSFTKATFYRTKWKLHDRPVWAVHGLRYDIGFLGSGLAVVVPDGFLTDGPSVPVWILRLLGLLRLHWVVESMVKSAAVHDMLRMDDRFTFLTGDCIYLMAMETEGTPLPIRSIAFLFVRLNRSREGVIRVEELTI